MNLGIVVFPWAEGLNVRATLRTGREWDVEPAEFPDRDLILSVLAGIAIEPHGPADGFYGPRQLRAAAALLGGTIADEAPQQEDRDLIY